MVARKNNKEQVQLGLDLPESGAEIELQPAVACGYVANNAFGLDPTVNFQNVVNEEIIPVNIFKLHPDVPEPKYATDGSMCFDLRAYLPAGSQVYGYDNWNRKIKKNVSVYAYEDNKQFTAVSIDPGERLLIPTGLIFDLPVNTSLILYPLSGVSLKQDIVLGNQTGIVDWDYVDPTFMILLNASATRLLIKGGERYAQGEVVKNPPRAHFTEIFERPEKKTTRAGGFGSTGK